MSNSLENKGLEIVENLPIGVYETNLQGDITWANSAMAELFDCQSIVQLKEMSAKDLYVEPVQREELLKEALEKGAVKNMILKLKKINGRTFFCSCSLKAVLEKGEVKYLRGSLIDVTETVCAKEERDRIHQALCKQKAKLEKLATHDVLTGLYNRRFFEEALRSRIEEHKRYHYTTSLLMLDIDYFKNINDTCGHDAGDEALKSLAQIMNDMSRDSDIIARYGGEEFMIICKEAILSNAANIAERIREKIEREMSCEVDGKKINITISIGVTEIGGKDTLKLVTKRADEALYQAKQTGRNKVCIWGEEEE